MTTATPSRRERLRTSTVAEIKQAARRLLVTGGPAAISLRAIARDMGMTAPAIYRYFSSLDALVIELTADFYEELRLTVEATGTAGAHGDPHDEAAGDPLHRVAEMARAFRRWARQHPAEFALMFGSPVPGVTDFERQCDAVQDAGARFGELFLDALTELYARHPFGSPSAHHLGAAFSERLGPYLDAHGDRYPLPVVYAFLAGWTRLYGLVATDIFGQLQWAVTDGEPLFEMELARFVAELAGPPAGSP